MSEAERRRQQEAQLRAEIDALKGQLDDQTQQVSLNETLGLALAGSPHHQTQGAVNYETIGDQTDGLGGLAGSAASWNPANQSLGAVDIPNGPMPDYTSMLSGAYDASTSPVKSNHQAVLGRSMNLLRESRDLDLSSVGINPNRMRATAGPGVSAALDTSAALGAQAAATLANMQRQTDPLTRKVTEWDTAIMQKEWEQKERAYKMQVGSLERQLGAQATTINTLSADARAHNVDDMVTQLADQLSQANKNVQELNADYVLVMEEQESRHKDEIRTLRQRHQEEIAAVQAKMKMLDFDHSQLHQTATEVRLDMQHELRGTTHAAQQSEVALRAKVEELTAANASQFKQIEMMKVELEESRALITEENQLREHIEMQNRKAKSTNLSVTQNRIKVKELGMHNERLRAKDKQNTTALAEARNLLAEAQSQYGGIEDQRRVREELEEALTAREQDLQEIQQLQQRVAELEHLLGEAAYDKEELTHYARTLAGPSLYPQPLTLATNRKEAEMEAAARGTLHNLTRPKGATTIAYNGSSPRSQTSRSSSQFIASSPSRASRNPRAASMLQSVADGRQATLLPGQRSFKASKTIDHIGPGDVQYGSGMYHSDPVLDSVGSGYGKPSVRGVVAPGQQVELRAGPYSNTLPLNNLNITQPRHQKLLERTDPSITNPRNIQGFKSNRVVHKEINLNAPTPPRKMKAAISATQQAVERFLVNDGLAGCHGVKLLTCGQKTHWFMFGTQRIHVSLQDGVLVVKVKDKFIPLSRYVQTQAGTEARKLKRAMRNQKQL